MLLLRRARMLGGEPNLRPWSEFPILVRRYRRKWRPEGIWLTILVFGLPDFGGNEAANGSGRTMFAARSR